MVNKIIKNTPIWCSVDLRDGNQALIEPWALKEKIECLVYYANLVLKK